MPREPKQLRRGKQFHERVQRDWLDNAGGSIHVEHNVPLASARRRRGRLDILVNDIGEHVAIVEIKATDWSRIKPRNIQRNLASHRRQIWRYIEKYLDDDEVSCFAGVIYPSPPANPSLRAKIESYFGEYGVTVVWFNEPVSAA